MLNRFIRYFGYFFKIINCNVTRRRPVNFDAVYHLDIFRTNVLFDIEKGLFKLIDFGISDTSLKRLMDETIKGAGFCMLPPEFAVGYTNYTDPEEKNKDADSDLLKNWDKYYKLAFKRAIHHEIKLMTPKSTDYDDLMRFADRYKHCNTLLGCFKNVWY